jgi:hypothetical protein
MVKIKIEYEIETFGFDEENLKQITLKQMKGLGLINIKFLN